MIRLIISFPIIISCWRTYSSSLSSSQQQQPSASPALSTSPPPLALPLTVQSTASTPNQSPGAQSSTSKSTSSGTPPLTVTSLLIWAAPASPSLLPAPSATPKPDHIPRANPSLLTAPRASIPSPTAIPMSSLPSMELTTPSVSPPKFPSAANLPSPNNDHTHFHHNYSHHNILSYLILSHLSNLGDAAMGKVFGHDLFQHFYSVFTNNFLPFWFLALLGLELWLLVSLVHHHLTPQLLSVPYKVMSC